MRTIMTALMASAMAIVGFTAAHAADAVDQVPQAPVAEEPMAITNWQGFYLGGAGTWNSGNFARSGADAFGGQIYGGYNWQSGKLVYGVEGDIGYSGADQTVNGIESKNEINGSVRGRLGYDLNPFLPYVTAGVAASENKASDATSSDSKGAWGYTVGAGVEAFVTNNITTRLEYRFTDYESKNYNLDSGSVSRGYDENSVKLGIGVKF